MFSPATAHILLWSIVGSSILLMLLRPRGFREVYWIGGGVISLVVLRLVPLALVGGPVAQGADVCFFLIGMGPFAIALCFITITSAAIDSWHASALATA